MGADVDVKDNKTIVFVSNFFSHHQEPFCEALNAMEGVTFFFIATMPFTNERLSMGWKIEDRDYIIYAFKNEEVRKKAERIAYEADVAIIGSAPDTYIVSRLRAKKLTFRYSERFYKQGLNVHNFWHEFGKALLHHSRFQRYPLYMLCSSAYTAGDCALFGNYINRTYKWGYFTEVKEYDVSDLMDKKISAISSKLKRPDVSILWAGRLIELKHPEAAIKLAEVLKKKGYTFKMSIIGNGEMELRLRDLIRISEVEDCVEMLGVMSPEEVRLHMEKADIFLFTSDFNEGWGAVLNEAMNSGCAVIASHAVGSAPFLIRDGRNGIIYENGNQDELIRATTYLIDNETERRQMGVSAYWTMVNMWNAKVAAERFMALCNVLTQKDKENFENGPCSVAERVHQKDMYRYCKRES